MAMTMLMTGYSNGYGFDNGYGHGYDNGYGYENGYGNRATSTPKQRQNRLPK